ncbi:MULTISPECIES: hypothetical protein [Deinococcus]|uniref:Uncharacterized protein n=2 Tax=Deinococcus TaxID=1298 RepID=A0A221T1C2_9DEIO|nr:MULTISPECIES: hypothetical protein [Deinococcus]ASN82676.1 hypothetical protein DFI_16065 [Deinococcus ficus]MDP9766090.1 hypothetical protein [Deinococcus enclensis]
MRTIYIQVNGGALQHVEAQDAGHLTDLAGAYFHSPASEADAAEFARAVWDEGFSTCVSSMLGGSRVWVIVGSDDRERIEAYQAQAEAPHSP